MPECPHCHALYYGDDKPPKPEQRVWEMFAASTSLTTYVEPKQHAERVANYADAMVEEWRKRGYR